LWILIGIIFFQTIVNLHNPVYVTDYVTDVNNTCGNILESCKLKLKDEFSSGLSSTRALIPNVKPKHEVGTWVISFILKVE
jgi:heterodisulfide reductase subunit A-like polyferredoxin